MSKNSEDAGIFEADLEAFQTFKRRWSESNLPADDLVIAKTKRLARKIARELFREDQADDLLQNAIIELTRKNYNGKTSLDKFILSILNRIKDKELSKSGSRRRSEVPGELSDTSSQESLIFRRISSEEFKDRLPANPTELQRTILMIVLDDDKQIEQRRLAKMASARLKRTVTRNQIDDALKELRKAIERPLSHGKGVAGWLSTAAQLRRGLTGRTHSNSTELAAEDRQR